MPEVSWFYGIRITMNFDDHVPPHIHATYGEYQAMLGISELAVIKGKLPNKAQFLVLEWLEIHQSELLAMWQSQKIQKLPPLK